MCIKKFRPHKQIKKNLLYSQNIATQRSPLLELGNILKHPSLLSIHNRLRDAAIGEVESDSVEYSKTLQSTLDACTGIVINIKLAADELNIIEFTKTSTKLIDSIDVGFENILNSLEKISLFLDGVSGDLDMAFVDTQAAMKTIINLLNTENPASFTAELDLIIVDLTTALSDLIDTAMVLSENILPDVESDVGQALIALEVVMQSLIAILKYTTASAAVVIETQILVEQSNLWSIVNGITDTLSEVYIILPDIHLIESNPTGSAQKKDIKDEL